MADGGGAACIAQLMAAHADDLRVQQICCGALAHIAQDNEAREAVIACAAPQAETTSSPPLPCPYPCP